VLTVDQDGGLSSSSIVCGYVPSDRTLRLMPYEPRMEGSGEDAVMHFEDVVLHVQGVVTQKMLPPFSRPMAKSVTFHLHGCNLS